MRQELQLEQAYSLFNEIDTVRSKIQASMESGECSLPFLKAHVLTANALVGALPVNISTELNTGMEDGTDVVVASMESVNTLKLILKNLGELIARLLKQLLTRLSALLANSNTTISSAKTRIVLAKENLEGKIQPKNPVFSFSNYNLLATKGEIDPKDFATFAEGLRKALEAVGNVNQRAVAELEGLVNAFKGNDGDDKIATVKAKLEELYAAANTELVKISLPQDASITKEWSIDVPSKTDTGESDFPTPGKTELFNAIKVVEGLIKTITRTSETNVRYERSLSSFEDKLSSVLEKSGGEDSTTQTQVNKLSTSVSLVVRRVNFQCTLLELAISYCREVGRYAVAASKAY